MKSRLIEGPGTSEEAWAACGKLEAIPKVTADTLVPRGKRCVVVAPHPDDEVLPCGGLLCELASRGCDIMIVAVTEGEKSHRSGSQWTPQRLRETRPIETRRALHHLGLGNSPIIHLGLPDGAVSSMAVADGLRGIVEPEDVIFTTWGLDGHPDHEATSKGVSQITRPIQASMIEMPIWGWHWAKPEEPRLPWASAVKFTINAGTLEQKQRAISEFHSQLQSDSETGQPAILPPTALRRFTRSWETYFVCNETR